MPVSKMNTIPWKKVTRFDGPESSPGFLLWQVSSRWRRAIEAALTAVELTHPQFVLLACLGWLTRDKNAVSQVELARYCDIDVNMTSQVLRTLEMKGYLERVRLDGNDRSKYPRLTEKGAKLVQKAVPIVEQADHTFFKSVQSEKFIGYLQDLIEKK